jgi:hypothetical protein|tara:strand:- start:206 stop:601 length:396 start_codon:yes stop_codon:yes gene_type:complete
MRQNMNKNSPNITEDTRTTASVAGKLPELTEEDIALAQTNVAWAAFYGNAEQGRVFQEDLGISLQPIDKGIVRCLSVGDDPYCYRVLAGMAHAFGLAGVELQLDPFTVTRPPPTEAPEERASTDEPGPEVV